ncbi:hypothetical protein BHE74_00052554 [Ensete ventricosum]|nr:hypothetical protein BHE74_00052554 [Ensete ventricosum]RZS19101.1 hypothetical protein BHM03_00051453 [Ensete ventricosum]
MRLNRVELFYALVAAIGSESRRCLRGRGGHMHAVCMQRWLATARPPVVAASHGLATYKGRPVAAKAPLQGGGRPQGQQLARGCRPRTALPPAGVVAPWQGDCRPQRVAIARVGAAVMTTTT